MSRIIFYLFEEDRIMAEKLSVELNAEMGLVELHSFPDQESLVRIHSVVDQKEIILICSLINPNLKIIPMIFFSKTAKEFGAKKISLIAPYLAYMRQDKSFQSSEGISSRYFSEILSNSFDALVTVDPHLHRYKSLSEIYTIPSAVVSSAPAIAAWIAGQVKNPYIIGPDMESEQWVADIAERVQAPYVILKKTRLGDQSVVVSLPKIEPDNSHALILLDDIISSGKTMLEAIKASRVFFNGNIVCIGVHAVFAGSAYEDLMKTGAEVVTTNSIQHPSNQIDLSELIQVFYL